MLLLDCPAHNLPYSKLCANQQCCDLLCDLCLPGHTQRTAHSTAIFLNAPALNFFQVFTHKIHAVMLQWAMTVRREGIGAIFVLRGEDGAEDNWSHLGNEVSEIAAKVLEEHGRLMANNCSFAASNCNSPLLYHPEFLRDLFNLIVRPWRVNAGLMLNRLAQSVAQLHVKIDKQMVHFELRQDASVQIQTFRRELVSHKQNGLLWHLSQQDVDKSLEGNTNDRSASSGGDLSCEGREVSQFHLSALLPSIKIIGSCGQVEQLAHPPMDCPSAAPQIAPENAQYIALKQSSENGSLLVDSMPKLLEQNRQLIKQSSLLKNENILLREEVQILEQKCLKMRCQRGQSGSSSKKYRDAELNGQLVGELVQLQVELSDNRHDLQILVEYLNCLSKQRIIDRSEFNCKMRALRTLVLH